jgi:hypothetical protein
MPRCGPARQSGCVLSAERTHRFSVSMELAKLVDETAAMEGPLNMLAGKEFVFRWRRTNNVSEAATRNGMSGQCASRYCSQVTI